ncbi:unnamed protein product [Lepeophtheirus salmonis]|uniref:(salmon louse) hypothetical protein n=1 Tax=Lepeophtheirus salmonis TaxID=72036 RepID=A0A7R8CUB3_LEPSM|nr:unnamed protein product [Lepeophtheirus salmonis]CAF2935097.1 unnamed protein product [Lepeophtheirus salmonis]
MGPPFHIGYNDTEHHGREWVFDAIDMKPFFNTEVPQNGRPWLYPPSIAPFQRSPNCGWMSLHPVEEFRTLGDSGLLAALCKELLLVNGGGPPKSSTYIMMVHFTTLNSLAKVLKPID